LYLIEAPELDFNGSELRGAYKLPILRILGIVSSDSEEKDLISSGDVIDFSGMINSMFNVEL
jgi:hypothetical protein